MQRNKERLTVTVDPEVIRAGNAAVRAGRAKSLSEWANSALVDRASDEKRERAARRAVKAFEAEFGAFTPAEIEAQAARDRASAVRVRAKRRSSRRAA